MFEYVETKRHTVESVYGEPEAEVLAKIDAKHEAVEFRIPEAGERCLSPLDFHAYESWGFTDGPRLILRRKTVKRRVLTETGDCRKAKCGEWYGSSNGSVWFCHCSESDGTYPIYRETFEEVEA